VAVSRKSIKGWPVIEDMNSPQLRLFEIPGADRKMRLRKDVGGYLVAFVSEYHRLIEPIDVGTFDDWSWAPPRKGRASNSISDHCAGVAVDLNATAEGSQSPSNVYWKKHPVKAMRMRGLLKKYRLLEWGGDYQRFFDPMHIVIEKPDVKAVKAEMKRLGIAADGTVKK